jgi:CyaY protein
MPKNDNAFISKAKKIIEELSFRIESLDSHNTLEIDFLDDVLTIDSPSGQFVLNQNAPVEQIWLSSPISGPHHFKCIDGIWLNKEGQSLHIILPSEISLILSL